MEDRACRRGTGDGLDPLTLVVAGSEVLTAADNLLSADHRGHSAALKNCLRGRCVVLSGAVELPRKALVRPTRGGLLCV